MSHEPGMREMAQGHPSCSVVIATIGRSECVLDCVRSLPSSLPKETEVLVVDASVANPLDEEVLRREWANASVVRSDVANAGSQRNQGIALARGEICVFLDDDCYVQPGWWPAIAEPFTDPKVGAVAGAVWRNPDPVLIDRPGGFVNIFGIPSQVTHRSSRAPRDVDWAVTCNMAVRTAAAREVGGLPEPYGIYDEDIDFGLKIRKAGWLIRFQPDAAVYHYTKSDGVPRSKGEAFRAGRNRAMLMTRHYGLLSVRTILLLATAPAVQLGSAVARSLRSVVSNCGRWAAYCVGLVAGVVDGKRHPVSEDRARFMRRGPDSEV